MGDFIKRNGYLLFIVGVIAVVGWGAAEILQMIPEPPPELSK